MQFHYKLLAAIGALLCLVAASEKTVNADVTYTANVLYSMQGFFNGAAVTSGIVAYGGQVVGFNQSQAVVYDASGVATNLGLGNGTYDSSSATSTDGQSEVGTGGYSSGYYHAVVWHGSAASFVDLNPANTSFSTALGVSGAYQVGFALNTGTKAHAFLWNGTAASAIDLTPAGVETAAATAVGGGQQVGYAEGGVLPNNYHAVMWTGTAASMVDLNPAGFDASFACAVGDGQQVGFGEVAANYDLHHASLWEGNAASVVDLNPVGFRESEAFGVGNGLQEGYGYGPTAGFDHALVWSGSAESAIDLGALLPSSFGDSIAYSSDANGDIFGVAFNARSAVPSAIEWVATSVPEPSGIFCVIAVVGLLRRNR